MPVLRQLYADGELNPAQSLIMAETRPIEELYHLTDDPWELDNLAANPAQAERLQRFRNILSDWERNTNDQGRVPENAAMYDSDMTPQIQKMRRKDPSTADILERNIALMKKWQQEGK